MAAYRDAPPLQRTTAVRLTGPRDFVAIWIGGFSVGLALLSTLAFLGTASASLPFSIGAGAMAWVCFGFAARHRTVVELSPRALLVHRWPRRPMSLPLSKIAGVACRRMGPWSHRVELRLEDRTEVIVLDRLRDPAFARYVESVLGDALAFHLD